MQIKQIMRQTLLSLIKIFFFETFKKLHDLFDLFDLSTQIKQNWGW